jgi:hypothetical protein
MGDRKCIGDQRKSFIGHPGATIFQRDPPRASFSTATRFIASNPDSEAAEQAITVANSHAKDLSTLLSSTLPSSFVSCFPSNFSFAFSAPLYKWINDTPELITAGQCFEAQTALRRKQSPHNK